MVRDRYALADSPVDLDVVRQVSRVSETGSKPASVDSVNAEGESMPVVNDSGGVRERLVVIQKDIVTVDELQFRRAEVELTRFHLRPLRDAPGEIIVCVYIVVRV